MSTTIYVHEAPCKAYKVHSTDALRAAFKLNVHKATCSRCLEIAKASVAAALDAGRIA